MFIIILLLTHCTLHCKNLILVKLDNILYSNSVCMGSVVNKHSIDIKKKLENMNDLDSIFNSKHCSFF